MKYLFVVFYLFFLIYPAEAVTTKMFKVLDTCARYRIGEVNANEAIEKLKLKLTNSGMIILSAKIFKRLPYLTFTKYLPIIDVRKLNL